MVAMDEAQAAKDLRARGLADAIIVSGRETGAEPDAGRFARVREAIDAPLLVGSGLTEGNAASFAAADGAIAGTSVKRDGRVDAARVARLVAAFRERGGR
jgi:predicted TIM-barrel enzyme